MTALAQHIDSAESAIRRVTHALTDLASLRALMYESTGRRISWLRDSSDAELADAILRMSHMKRFSERCRADPAFRALARKKPGEAVARLRLALDTAEATAIAHPEAPRSKAPISVRRCRQYLRGLLHWRDNLRRLPASSPERRFTAWRARQIARADSQLYEAMNDEIIHSPLAFELSQGCSVGCRFCGVSAPRLSDLFTYTEDNARFWRATVDVMVDRLGAAAAAGFCYWATDPIDNPDYDRFVSDFHAITGAFPQTTTAIPLKDAARTRRIMRVSLLKGCAVNRFSILTLRTLERVHEEFLPEELFFVQMVFQNKEASPTFAQAGRALLAPAPTVDASGEAPDITVGRTIACVSGFLLNMVRRDVRLISPWPADARWPMGYRVYDERRFQTPGELASVVADMIERAMPARLPAEDVVRFRPDLKVRMRRDGMLLETPAATFAFAGGADVRRLGETISGGSRTAGEIRRTSPVGRETLSLLYRNGLLDDQVDD